MPDPAPPARRSLLRRLRHRIRPRIARPLARLATLVAPPLYLAYMRLVWSTSEIDADSLASLHELVRRRDGAVGVLWHEEVFAVPYGWGWAGFTPHTLASLGDAGEVVTRILQRCGYVVFRGGSASRASRRRAGVIRAMAEHMRSRREVVYGITVDGSKGPPYRMKPGALAIARACGRPLVLVRLWPRRCLRLRTWDRTAIPLPFNTMRFSWRGPFDVPEDAGQREGRERFRRRLERELAGLAAESYDAFGQARPEALAAVLAAEPEAAT